MNTISLIILAGLFSIFESPMQKFGEQYYEESYKLKLAEIDRMEAAFNSKCMKENAEFEYKMETRRQNAGSNQDALDAYELRMLQQMTDRNYRHAQYFNNQRREIEKEHKRLRHEYDMRKKAFNLRGGTPSEQESIALEKFKANGCKISRLNSEEREILYAWFLRGSKDWARVRYVRGHYKID